MFEDMVNNYLEQRPKIKLPLSALEIILQIASVFVVAAMYALLVVNWELLPEQVPTFFGANGLPVSWGDKSTLLSTPIIVSVFYIIITWTERFPHKYTYLVRITEDNLLFQYKNARLMTTCLKLEAFLFFLYLEFVTIQIAMDKAEGIGSIFFWAAFVIFVGSFGFFIHRMVKNK